MKRWQERAIYVVLAVTVLAVVLAGGIAIGHNHHHSHKAQLSATASTSSVPAAATTATTTPMPSTTLYAGGVVSRTQVVTVPPSIVYVPSSPSPTRADQQPSAPPQTSSPPTQRTWTKAFTFSGSGGLQSGDFTMQTGQGRATVTVDDREDFYLYVYRSGATSRDTPAAIPMSCGARCSQTSFFNVPPGSYYLQVDSAASNWYLTIDEAR